MSNHIKGKKTQEFNQLVYVHWCNCNLFYCKCPSDISYITWSTLFDAYVAHCNSLCFTTNNCPSFSTKLWGQSLVLKVFFQFKKTLDWFRVCMHKKTILLELIHGHLLLSLDHRRYYAICVLCQHSRAAWVGRQTNFISLMRIDLCKSRNPETAKDLAESLQ